MPRTLLEPAALRRALALRDQTDPAHGPHAMQALLDEIEAALAATLRVPVRRHRAHPVVGTTDNYDRLGYPPEAVTRDARYTRYVTSTTVLRSQTSAMLPPLLDRLAAETAGAVGMGMAVGPAAAGAACVPVSAWPAGRARAARQGGAAARAGGTVLDVVLSCPGLVYRRDVIDRHHVGEPHQVDLWRVRIVRPAAGPGVRPPLGRGDLDEMIATVIGAALPGRAWRAVPAAHPYTLDGLQIDVADRGGWVEVGECGLANPCVLSACGLAPPAASGLAMGLGLDRLLMLRKGIEDIRLLRAADPRVAEQMLDLSPYRPVSAMPAIRRDLSVAVSAGATPEELGDQVRAALGPRVSAVESIELMSETPLAELPEAARERLGIRPGQKNVLLRLVLRDLGRTLTDDDANRLRDLVYAAIHAGDVQTWATRGKTATRPEAAGPEAAGSPETAASRSDEGSRRADRSSDAWRLGPVRRASGDSGAPRLR